MIPTIFGIFLESIFAHGMMHNSFRSYQLLTMFQTIIIASLAASAVAFRPAPMARASLAKVSMSAEGLAGQTAPLGFFDPLGLSAGKTVGEVKVRKILRA